jgi:hypothetical protein
LGLQRFVEFQRRRKERYLRPRKTIFRIEKIMPLG